MSMDINQKLGAADPSESESQGNDLPSAQSFPADSGSDETQSPPDESCNASSFPATSPGCQLLDPAHPVKSVSSGSAKTESGPPLTGKKVSRQERRRNEREKRKFKAPPLNVDNVLAVLGTSPWRDVGEHYLHVPVSKLNTIESEYSTDKERLAAVVRHWVLWDPYASWRRLMHRLYCENKSDMIEKIKNYAEKQPDSSLTFDSLLAALDTVRNAKEVSGTKIGFFERVLEIPYPKRDEMRLQYTEDADYRGELVKHYLRTFPRAGWNHLAGRLLYFGEHKALEKVKRNVKPDKDPSLTLGNLTQLLKDVEDWNHVGYYLDTPQSVSEQIISHHSSVSEREEACWRWYLDNHLSPSWRQVAYAIYERREHAVLEVLKSRYLKGSSESRRLYNEAMREGFIRAEINKILIYGASGTGKSTSMDLFVGNPPRQVRRSTPIATRPVTMFHVDVTSKEWKKLSSNERKQMLARAIAARRPIDSSNSAKASDSADEDSGSGEVVDSGEMSTQMEVDTDPEHSDARTREDRSSTRDRNPRVHPVSLSSPTAASRKPRSPTSLPSITSTHDELVQLMDIESGKALSIFRKLNLIDSGGQPQFHEVLPMFLRRMSLYIFVFKLSEELATKPMVEYFNEQGLRVGTPYPSALSNEQLLEHCLRTMHTHRSCEGECSKIMIVGTHRDLEHMCKNEMREEKNKKLADLLLPVFQDEVIYYKLSPDNEFIFPLNAKDPVEFDRHIVESIQNSILTECKPAPIDVPLRYFSLEILLEEVSLSLNRDILSKEECLKEAKALYFNEHTLGAALQFLDEISVVFYFPEILENVVFTNPQVLLDKVTELVEKIYYLREKKVIALPGIWQKFKDHGIVSLELLQKEGFKKYYVPEIFTAADLVKLFRKLLIIADFNASEYIMPALLPVLEKEKVHNYRLTNDSLISPLALDFPLGSPRLGTYCSLVCFLVSPDNQFPCPWKIVLLPHSNTPACLNRNCTRFSVPGFPGSVTLIDTFKHFEVHVHTSRTSRLKLCSLVSKAIFAGVKKATVVLGYNNSIPSKALLCPCGNGDPHVATFGDEEWICSRDFDVFGELTSRQLPWCPSSAKIPLDFKIVQEASWKARCKWYDIGVQLDLDTATLDSISTNCHEKVEHCFNEVLKKWLTCTTPCPSWDALVEALRAPTVDYNNLASEIESKYIED